MDWGCALDRSFAEYVLVRSLANESDVSRARRVSEGTRESIVQTLAQLGIVTERQLADALSEYSGYRCWDDEEGQVSDAHELLNSQFLKHHLIAPVRSLGPHPAFAVFDPLDSAGPNGVRFALGREVELCVAERSQILKLISDMAEGSEGGANDTVSRTANDREKADMLRIQDSASDAPAISAVQRMIDEALHARATDIHIEPGRNGLGVRYRIDGVLRDAVAPPAGLAGAVVSRIKVLADLDIAETRRPQDGSFRVASRGHPIDVRVATSPTAHGESVVLRLLGRTHVEPDLEKLGFEAGIRTTIERAMEAPNGIVLVTGPTGSGKSTTLYAMINRLNTGDRKILTIEDPVEYEIDNVNQVEVNEKIGLTFAAALRSFLRQDPDIMMVGEIRDSETADIAVRAALTGHMVLSTLHTNSALATVARLVDIGVEPSLMAATVRIIIAQRLVRRLCPECKQPAELAEDDRDRLGRVGARACPDITYQPVGCAHCGQTGYFGRVAVAELLRFSPRICDLVERGVSERELERAAAEEGFAPLLDDGLAKIAAGETSVDEVLRVVRAADG